mmetsp:Transcript_117770/g.333834  ORF Transcript_117770/g.333834 Transcript_117770/m.333834 type:complete len:220 (-) Transcript_117770:22-681(-)
MSGALAAALLLTSAARASALARGRADPVNGTLDGGWNTPCRVDEREAWAPLRNILNHVQGKISSDMVVPPITPPPNCNFKYLAEQGQVLTGHVASRCYHDWGLPDELGTCWGNLLAEETYNCNEQCSTNYKWDTCSQCKREYVWKRFRCRTEALQTSMMCTKCHSQAYSFYLDNCEHVCEGFFDYDTQLQRGIVTAKQCMQCNDKFWAMENECFGDELT